MRTWSCLRTYGWGEEPETGAWQAEDCDSQLGALPAGAYVNV